MFKSNSYLYFGRTIFNFPYTLFCIHTVTMYSTPLQYTRGLYAVTKLPLHRLLWFALYLRNNNLATSKERGRDTAAGVRHQHSRFSTSYHKTAPLIWLLVKSHD